MVNNKQNKNIKDSIIDAILSLAASQGWKNISFEDVATEAGVDLADAREYFDDKLDIIGAYGRKLDRDMAENVSVDDDMSHREQVFDILMERFDLLNENRDAIVSMLDSMKGDPKDAVMGLPHLARSMTRVLEIAKIPTSGLTGCGRVLALTGLYVYVLRTWKDDDTADMAKTMAALDKALDKAEMLYNALPMA